MALDQYVPIVGQSTVDELRLIARKLNGKVIKNVNSTAVGGGVAEILNRIVPLLVELGIDARWDVIKGGERFFAVTKKIHNALHGAVQEFTLEDREAFLEVQENNARLMDLGADVLFIHDPQPAGLVAFRKGREGRWIWRCHIDLSAPQPEVWRFLKPMVEQYEAAVFSAPAFSQSLSMRQVLIAPSIDPLSDKNREMTESEIATVCARLNIPRDKPLITQVSRFDYLKDPLGVIDAFQLAKEHIDARLLLVGGSASDDPEGAKVLSEVQERASGDPDILVLCLPPTSNIEINAIQRASDIILQKSIKEGFGLTVSEALWKAKPVIAGAVGGIPLQIDHKYSGILTRSVEGTAYWIKRLLQSPDFARQIGENGREHVRQNFLLTRHLRDYLLLFLAMNYPGKDLIYLR